MKDTLWSGGLSELQTVLTTRYDLLQCNNHSSLCLCLRFRGHKTMLNYDASIYQPLLSVIPLISKVSDMYRCATHSLLTVK